MPLVPRRSAVLLALVPGLAALALPAPALASEARIEGSTLVVAAAPGERNMFSATYEATNAEFVVGDLRAELTAGAGCAPASGGGIGCPAAGLTSIRIIADDGDDSVQIEDSGNPLPADVDGGAGIDDLNAGRGPNVLRGGPDNDKLRGHQGNDVLDGGDGDDDLAGRMGNDTLLAGPGKDVMYELRTNNNGDGADLIDGGDGFDTVYYSDRNTDLSLSLDGAANDGAAGEGDNLAAATDQVIGGVGNDRLSGDDAANRLEGFDGVDQITGGGGDDYLDGGDGNDGVDAGPGNDTAGGGDGDDLVDGGPGADKLQGDLLEGFASASGSDTIRARDGEADQVACGAGADAVVVDTRDVVAADCDSVDRQAVAGAPGTPGGGGGDGGGAPGGGGSAVGANPTAKVAKTQKARKGVITFTASCSEACEFTTRGSTISIPKAGKYKLPVKTRELAAGQKVKIKLKLSRKLRGRVRKAIRKGRKVKASLLLTSYYSGDRVGGPIARTVRLR